MKLFTEQQYRGLLILVPVAVVLVAISVAIELLRPVEQTEVKPEWQKSEKRDMVAEAESAVELKNFDPNTFSYEQLREAGLSREVAVGVVRWRSYGKVYRVREDMALVSGMNDSIYAAIKPYIVIADSIAAKPKPNTWRKEHVVQNRTSACVAQRDKQPNERPQEQTFATSDERSDSAWQSRKIGVREPLLEINSADTTALIALRGIGSKSAIEIVRYRELLGGYHSVEQISELKCVTEQNYEQILQQIYCDSCKIKKIDINFAPPKEVARHPYVSAHALRKVIKQRQLKGGWSRIEEMVEDEILSEDEAKRLAPYLWFRLDATE